MSQMVLMLILKLKYYFKKEGVMAKLASHCKNEQQKSVDTVDV